MNDTPRKTFAARLDSLLEPAEISKKRSRLMASLCFLIPFLSMFVIYIFDLIFPFSWNSVLVLDLNGQYVGFYEALRAFVWGDGSMLYSFARSLGGEMMGIYAYYIASPLSYIVALFPEAMMTEALLFIFILKAGLCGLTFGLYLRHTKAVPDYLAVMFSTLYALQSFAIVMQHNSMWIDNLILLPLVTWGIESVVKYRRYRLFVASLALALLSNFYIGYMTCIYVFIYFIYYTVAFSRDGRNNPLGEKQHTLRALVRMGLYSVIAVGIAAIILLSTAYSLSLGKSDFSTPNYTPFFRFDFLSFFAKLMPAVYDTVEPEGLPFVFCGTLTVLLVPLYFMNRRFRRRERMASFFLLLVFYFSMAVSTVDILWHGGQVPNWLNYRYSFMLVFLLLVMASRAFARLGDTSPRKLLATGGVTLLLVGGAAGMQLSYFPWYMALIGAVTLGIYLLLLLGIRTSRRPFRSVLSLLLCVVILTEVIANGVFSLYGLHDNVGAIPRDHYSAYHEVYQPAVDYIKDLDDGFYRTETEEHRTTNDAMELGYNGLTNSTSTLNAHTLQFLHRLGMLSEANYSKYKGRTLVLDSLLGVKYIFGDANRYYHPFGYTRIETIDKISVWKNPYALPIAYAVSDDIKSADLSDLLSGPPGTQNTLVSALLGKEVALYTPVTPYKTELTNVSRYFLTDQLTGMTYVEYRSDVYEENRAAIEDQTVNAADLTAPDATITYRIRADQRGRLYFYMPTEYRSQLTLIVDGRELDPIFGVEGDYLHDLGGFVPGQEITVTLRMDACARAFHLARANLFYFENLDTVKESMTSLAENGITLEEWSDTYFRGSITTTESRPTVMTTIPYDKGWEVTVDGVRVETYESLEALLTFDLAPGTHTVEMRYAPRAYLLGRTITLISLAVFLLLLLLEELLRRGILCPRKDGFLDRALNVFFFCGEIPAPIHAFLDENMLPVRKKPTADGEDMPEGEGATGGAGSPSADGEEGKSDPDGESEESAEPATDESEDRTDE